MPKLIKSPDFRKMVAAGDLPSGSFAIVKFDAGGISPIQSTAKTDDVDAGDKADRGSFKIPFVISTSAVDREGDTISIDGWDISDFSKGAGSVLFGHDPMSPVARAVKTWVSGGALKSIAEFPSEADFAFGNLIGRLVKMGVINGASVGFIPTEWEVNQDRSADRSAPAIDFTAQKLLEWSVTPIPANPEALADVSKSVDVRPLYDWSLTQLDTDDTDPLAKDGAQMIYKSLGSIFKPKASKPKTVITWAAAHVDGTPVADRDAEWDGPGEVAEAEIDDLEAMATWRADKAAEDLTKGDYKLPHHRAAGDHAVVWSGVTSAMGALLGARGGVDIPEDDRAGVYAHLARHYRNDFDVDPPEFREYSDAELKDLFGQYDASDALDFSDLFSDIGDIWDSGDTDSGDDFDRAFDDLVSKESALIDGAIDSLKVVAKRGRVLSAANENKLQNARDILDQVLGAVRADDAAGDGDRAADKTTDQTAGDGDFVDGETLELIPNMVRQALAECMRRASGSLD